jgi:pimeloyl-ACP methyl ester carboxylesterase
MKKILLAIVVLVVLVGVGFGAAFYFRPISTFERMGRRVLAGAGLARGVVEGPKGPIETWSSGSGPVVILVHGANDYAGTWGRVVPALLQTNRVVAYDMPGHGNSAPASGPLSIGDLVAGLESVAALERAPVTLVGNSLGGWVALNVAKRKPASVGHVILVNGAATEAKFGEGIDLLPKDRESARRSMEGIAGPNAPKTPDFVLDDLVRRAPASALARIMSKPIEREWFIDDALPSMDVPVTVIWGEADRLLPLAYARGFVPLLRRGRLETLPACGHMPQRECPAALAPALLKAIATPPPPNPPPSTSPVPSPTPAP